VFAASVKLSIKNVCKNETMRDSLLLLALRLRHLQTAFNFIVGGMIGADFVKDRSLNERLYQVFTIATVGVSFAL